ncbi:DUF3137 domain-containing protein [Actinophytocola gossypii]|uniref:DUF3137 domain-containing protein n=1 Tax=Actinophytocola gossypii TaxID=2812003 RepID=A0ABT2JDT2_9PSEU|nr:DUF3137 domain-containing protein [Actinophytocola gossypii]MCT2586034.1 hypothetical protein [Actinophytocola gossypii]
MDLGNVLLVVGALVVIAGWTWYQWQARKKKAGEFSTVAAQRGWEYQDVDESRINRFLGTPFGEGHSRRAEHVLRGTYRGRTMQAFEYSYKETRGRGDHIYSESYKRANLRAGNTEHISPHQDTKTYRFTVVSLLSPAPRPTLEVTREGWGRKLLGMVGVKDLQLESEQFNKTFHIRTNADKFAYDILHPRMMEWMLTDQRAQSIPFRFERGDIVVWDEGRIELAKVDQLLEYASEILDRTPDFVWKD